MKSVLSFTLPEEDPEFKVAYYGPEMHLAISELVADLKSWRKHDSFPEQLNSREDLATYVIGHFSEVLGKLE